MSCSVLAVRSDDYGRDQLSQESFDEVSNTLREVIGKPYEESVEPISFRKHLKQAIDH